MGRQSRTGVDFFSMDTDFFSDRKVKTLRARFGGDGITFFMYVLCEIYRDKGYYLATDEDFEDNAAADLGVSSEKIGLMLHFLLNKSLLDGTLFSKDKVLSSHGIQLRFQKAVKARAMKTPISVDCELWLLDENETCGYIKVQKKDDTSEKKADFSANNPDCSEKNDTKETKRKETTRKEQTQAPDGAGENPLDRLTDRVRPTVERWLEYKREKKQGYKPTGLNAFISEVLNNCVKFSEADVCRVINKSMASNYQGVTWDWLKNEPKLGGNVFMEMLEGENG